MKNFRNTLTQGHQGFVILFVVLIAAIILLIGAGIFTISFKENILSSTARESQLALSAADAGVECALYHDIEFLAFSSSAPVASIECADTTLSVTNPAPEEFKFSLPLENVMHLSGVTLPCAHVTVDKNYLDPDDSQLYTRILSQGYNVCDSHAEPVVTDPLLLERMYEVQYLNPVAPPLSASASSTIPAATATTSATIPAATTSIPSLSTSRSSSPIIE